MKRGRRIISITIALCAVMVLAYGYSTSKQVFKNHLHTGSVLVKVTEFEELDGQVTPIRGEELFIETVKDGKLVSYIPRVTTLADDSYVRLNVRITGNDGINIPVNDETIQDVSDAWVRKGNSFYCKHIMKAGEEEDPFAGIVVPREMKQVKKIHVDVTADAIQAMNLKPDFESANPWETGAGSIHADVSRGEPYHIVFRKEQEVKCGSTDLFDNFSTFMPGDLKTGSLIINNQTGKDADVYLQTVAEGSELLQRIRLTVRCGEKLVYKGSLRSEALQDKVVITSLKDHTADTLQFELTLPADADNRFASSAEDVDWILSIQNTEKTDTRLDSGKRGADMTKTADNVVMGDKILPLMIAAGLIALALIALALAVVLGRRRV